MVKRGEVRQTQAGRKARGHASVQLGLSSDGLGKAAQYVVEESQGGCSGSVMHRSRPERSCVVMLVENLVTGSVGTYDLSTPGMSDHSPALADVLHHP